MPLSRHSQKPKLEVPDKVPIGKLVTEGHQLLSVVPQHFEDGEGFSAGVEDHQQRVTMSTDWWSRSQVTVGC